MPRFTAIPIDAIFLLAVIHTLASFGLRGERRPPWTGLWIGNKKIASIGIAVKRGITYHGLALNVNTDLSYFQRIVPCGLPWAEITSMEREVGHRLPLEQVKAEFLQRFVKKFGYSEIRELCHEYTQTGSKPDSLAVPTTPPPPPTSCRTTTTPPTPRSGAPPT